MEFLNQQLFEFIRVKKNLDGINQKYVPAKNQIFMIDENTIDNLENFL
jgi:hypothetical protein